MIRFHNAPKLVRSGFYLLMGLFLIFLQAPTNRIRASVNSYKTAANVVIFTLDKGGMSVKICKEDLVEIKYLSLIHI